MRQVWPTICLLVVLGTAVTWMVTTVYTPKAVVVMVVALIMFILTQPAPKS